MPIVSNMPKAALIAIALGCASLGSPLSAMAEDVTLDVMYPWPESKSFHEPLAQSFMAANPDIKIKFRLSPPDYTEATLAIARGALTGDLPDVYFSGYSELNAMVETLSKRKQAVPLTPFIQAEGSEWISENFGQALLALGQVDGTQYAIPFNASTPIIYFNADLVKHAGHDPDAFPKDWDGLIKLAHDIGALGNGISGMDFSVGAIESDWDWQATVLSYGGEMVSADGRTVGFDNQIGLSAMKLLQRIANDTKMNVAAKASAYQQQFFAGKLGFFVTSPSSVANFTKTVGGRFEMRTATFPIAAKNGGLPTGGNAVAITAKDQKHRDAAWKYVKFVTGPESQAFVARSTGYMPTNLKAGDTLKEFYVQNPTYATAFKQVGFARPWYSYPRGNSKEIWAAQRQVFDQLQRGSITPEDGLKRLVDATNSLLQN
ncbi:ABC transporter substrate-binding protein [Agrobacterium sp. LAD9]|uniref:ABC transporter substrate-binding protein n=1 Tax=Agrobacterium sp. LAD9 TaxID=2055153 RepID=UPI0012906607|nr:ABC transporter substrate-binding protein [Agrobacterium sp. LAD9]